MGHAVNLQTLLTALASKYALQGRWTHAHIPDDPGTESERRQIFFCAAIGIPTVFILSDTRNLFLKEIVSRTRHVRFSRRYQGYLRIYCRQYCLALLEMLARDGADLIEALGMQETVDDLRMRLHDPDTHGAAGKLTSQILGKLGESSTLNVKAREFNECAEQYYRTELRQKHIDEAFRLFQEDVWAMESSVGACGSVSREILHAWGMGSEIRGFLSSVQQRLGYEELDVRELEKLGHLLLATIHLDSLRAKETPRSEWNHDVNSAPVRGAGDRQDLYGAALLG